MVNDLLAGKVSEGFLLLDAYLAMAQRDKTRQRQGGSGYTELKRMQRAMHENVSSFWVCA
jgi:hypothetical protein